MNIVHVIGDLDTGGAEAMLYKLVKSLNDRSHKISVISLQDDGVYGKALKELGVDVYTLGLSSSYRSLFKLKKLIALLRRLRPDVVQSWMYHSNILMSLVALIPFMRLHVVWNIRHALHDLSSEKKLTRVIIRLGAFLSWQPQKIIFNATESLQQHQTLGYIKSKLLMLPNGFDLERYRPDKMARQGMIERLGLPEDSCFIGVVARFHPAKGHKYFVEAASKIARENTHAHFLLIGRQVDADNAQLLQWIEKTGYADRFHLFGEQADSSSFFPAFTVLVNPSTTEAFPNVIGEAMACGTPCVVTDVGDSKSIVGEYGRTVPAKNSDALSHAVLALLSLNTAELEAMGLEARKRIMENFSIETVTKQYENLYLVCRRSS